jgi:hypothetical protein
MILSPASRAWVFLGDVNPGLRSLRSLTRGYYLSSLRDSLTHTCNVACMLTVALLLLAQSNKSLDASGGRVENIPGRYRSRY